MYQNVKSFNVKQIVLKYVCVCYTWIVCCSTIHKCYFRHSCNTTVKFCIYNSNRYTIISCLTSSYINRNSSPRTTLNKIIKEKY